MNRLIFLNRYFFPDHSATSQILSDLAFHLARSGREVHSHESAADDNQKACYRAEGVAGDIHRVRGTVPAFWLVWSGSRLFLVLRLDMAIDPVAGAKR